MKLSYLILSVMLLTGYNSYAQNTPWSTSGPIGIGTISPTTTLEINGSFKAGSGGNQFSYSGGADLVLKVPSRGVGGRAIVHDESNVLTLNYNGDFTGGTRIGLNPFFAETNNGVSFINSGNVGIGTTTPTSLLTLNSVTGAVVVLQKGGSNVAALSVDGTSSTWNGGGAVGLNLIATSADISLKTGNPAITTFLVKNNGNVGIGISNPQNKLDVNGTIHSKEVKIDLSGWSDYVFKKDYRLPSLAEVKNYIDQNQHLPEVPSEQEIVKNGLNVGEMNKLLMKKVEELTLYLIEKDQKEKQQEQRIQKLEQQLNTLINKINQ